MATINRPITGEAESSEEYSLDTLHGSLQKAVDKYEKFEAAGKQDKLAEVRRIGTEIIGKIKKTMLKENEGNPSKVAKEIRFDKLFTFAANMGIEGAGEDGLIQRPLNEQTGSAEEMSVYLGDAIENYRQSEAKSDVDQMKKQFAVIQMMVEILDTAITREHKGKRSSAMKDDRFQGLFEEAGVIRKGTESFGRAPKYDNHQRKVTLYRKSAFADRIG